MSLRKNAYTKLRKWNSTKLIGFGLFRFRKQFITSGLVSCLVIILCSCSQFANSQVSKLLSPDEKLVIPFQYDGQFITISVRLNDGFLLNFIVDTGAENLIILKKSIADFLGCTYTQEIPLYGSDLKVVRYALISPYVKLDIGQENLVYSNFIVFKNDETSLDGYSGKPIHGIIGGKLLSRYKTRINFKKGEITLYGNRYNVKGLQKYDSTSIKVLNNKPYMTVTVKKNQISDRKTLLLDSGAGINGLFIIDSTEYLNQTTALTYGIIGRSINGPILGYLGKVDEIVNPVIHIPEPIISYQQVDSLHLPKNFIQRDGVIGNHILKDYDFIVDYRNNILYMKQIRKPDEWAYDRSGLSIKASGIYFNQYEVEYVVPNSPADLAGLKKGDNITSLQRIPRFFLNLSWINKKLQKKGNKLINIKVLRNGEKLKMSFRLRDL